jgi:ABC-type sulfate transport system permease component
MTTRKNVLPGFNLSLGYTIFYLSLIVLIPLSAAFIKTTSISGSQWLICIAVASSVLWAEEIRKAITRFTRKESNS